VNSDAFVQVANHVWQSSLFAAAIWLTALALRQNRAAVRHALWVAASVKFLIPLSFLMDIGSRFQRPFFPLAPPPEISVFVGAIGEPFVAPARAIGATPSGTNWFLEIAFYAWMIGLVASVAWWGIQWLRLYKAARQATPMSLNTSIRVLSHSARLEPGVFGIFRPVLLMPEGIVDQLSPEQLQAVIAHELCHVRRRDNLTAAIHMVAEAVFWFYPLVRLIKARLVDEQERACDEEVLRLGGDPEDYAKSILKICECYLTSPSMCVAGITRFNLKNRIEDIMRNRIPAELSLSKSFALAVFAILMLASPLFLGFARASLSESPEILVAVKVPSSPQAGPRGTGGASDLTAGYRIGEIVIRGNTRISSNTILLQLDLRVGDTYDESRLRESFKKLMSLYGDAGYITFYPEPSFNIDEQKKAMTLIININEGPQYFVNHVGFSGNIKTTDEVLRRELELKEGMVFNASLLKLTVARLNRLGLFEEIRETDVRVTPAPDGPRADVEFRVRERQ
jgi:beta-lactamase regulating signal transducer with metallopeptidase domain